MRLSIHWKLAILSGPPLLGVAALAWLVVADAHTEAAAAKPLASIEELAALSDHVRSTVGRLQDERVASLRELSIPNGPRNERDQALSAELRQKQLATDRATRELDQFLDETQSGALPKGLASALADASQHLDELGAFRTALSNQAGPPRKGRAQDPSEDTSPGQLAPGSSAPDVDALAELLAATDESPVKSDLREPLANTLVFYGAVDAKLIRALSELTSLSNDGEMLRGLTRLERVMNTSERNSVQHATLSYVFAVGPLPSRFVS